MPTSGANRSSHDRLQRENRMQSGWWLLPGVLLGGGCWAVLLSQALTLI
ncbi:hypothetical protein SPO2525 [Ruegeria pomeroyi DSS-3]|uniref:Uncharacterized protein n=1 Tax=Ruegeria pomeroyi (strain ATCC 700808 / DSM 15171 / DSS-3) TaxID=246200 RepID=Q5LQG5_RUEPO|nr:hypothetical protein SPO2525 [Ruegeria pomeroyi DSS-3]